jgi:hypothetical protein
VRRLCSRRLPARVNRHCAFVICTGQQDGTTQHSFRDPRHATWWDFRPRAVEGIPILLPVIESRGPATRPRWRQNGRHRAGARLVAGDDKHRAVHLSSRRCGLSKNDRFRTARAALSITMHHHLLNRAWPSDSVCGQFPAAPRAVSHDCSGLARRDNAGRDAGVVLQSVEDNSVLSALSPRAATRPTITTPMGPITTFTFGRSVHAMMQNASGHMVRIAADVDTDEPLQ